MWIVKNVLRGALYIDDLDVKIPPKDYFDLDKLGRERVNQSEQIRLAFEEGYLQNVKKDADPEAGVVELPGAQDGVVEIAAIQDRLRELQEMIARGFTLTQIEARLSALQDEMRLSGAYSDRLQLLMNEFRNTLLATGAYQPAAAPMHVPPPQAPYPANPLYAAGQYSVPYATPPHAAPAQPAPMPAPAAPPSDEIQKKLSGIYESLHQLKSAMLQPAKPAVRVSAEAPRPVTVIRPMPAVAVPPPAAPAAPDVNALLQELNQLKAMMARPAAPAPAVQVHVPPMQMPETVAPEKLSDELSGFRNLLLKDLKQVIRDVARPGAANGAAPIATRMEDLSDSEIRARLAVLTEREGEIHSNIRKIGQQSQGQSNAESIADLLCDI